MKLYLFKRLIGICLFSINFIVNAQTMLPPELISYYQHANNANFLNFKKDYQKSNEELFKAFAVVEPKAEQVILLIKNYSQLQQLDSVDKWLGYGIAKFELPKYVFGKDEYISRLDFEKKFKSDYLVFFSSLTKVLTISEINHYTRNDIFFHGQIFTLDPQNFDSKKALNLSQKYDSAYAVPYMKKLIENYHFPNATDLGYQTEMNINAIIRHYHQFERPTFNQALWDGKMTPSQYASIVDYFFNWNMDELLVPNRKPGPIGPKNNYAVNMNKTGEDKYKIAAINNVAQVDERRASIGLPPLWQTAKINGYELCDEYLDYLKKNKIKTE